MFSKPSCKRSYEGWKATETKTDSDLVVPITSPTRLIRKNSGFRFSNCQLKCRFFKNIVRPSKPTRPGSYDELRWPVGGCNGASSLLRESRPRPPDRKHERI